MIEKKSGKSQRFAGFLFLIIPEYDAYGNGCRGDDRLMEQETQKYSYHCKDNEKSSTGVELLKFGR